MLAGTHNSENKVNVVLKAPKDLAFSLDIKRERQRNGQYWPIGLLESVIFENDRDCQLDTFDARQVGRRLYWPENHSTLALTVPENDLIFTDKLKLPLPNIPHAGALIPNPYKVDRYGISRLKKGEAPRQAQLFPQRLEQIASAKYRNFLVFQPVAQIITCTKGGFGVFGSHRFPMTALTGFDNTKMALLIDPYTGEAVVLGGRLTNFDVHGQEGPSEVAGKTLLGHVAVKG